MKRQQIIFFLAGLIAGLTCVTLGSFGFLGFFESLGLLLLIVGLIYLVGPLFFVAVAMGILITGARRRVTGGFLRYLAGLAVSTITYIAAFLAFWGVMGNLSEWLGLPQSANFEDFGIDVWLGFVAAGVVGASGIALFAAVLTGKWSNSLLFRLILAGLGTIVVTFIANLPFHSYWSFFGILLPLGNALFCCLVGTQIWRNPEEAKKN
ncbi:MAG TPA: hypothetical protein VGJ55_08495 [Pyrinomonadaceae bacterium]|jgi:hypothetical protein